MYINVRCPIWSALRISRPAHSMTSSCLQKSTVEVNCWKFSGLTLKSPRSKQGVCSRPSSTPARDSTACCNGSRYCLYLGPRLFRIISGGWRCSEHTTSRCPFPSSTNAMEWSRETVRIRMANCKTAFSLRTQRALGKIRAVPWRMLNGESHSYYFVSNKTR